MAFHHLEHDRKRTLYAEVFDLLGPGGVFAKSRDVASPTRRLPLNFFAASASHSSTRTPTDRLLGVEAQFGYLREAGFAEVDCYWKWLEMAFLIGVKPGEQE